MGPHRTAGLSDGTDSRSAWFAWMVAGFFFSNFVSNLAHTVSAAASIMTARGTLPGGPFVTGIAFVVETALFGLLIAVGVKFATKRLMMPRSVWFSFAVVPVILMVLSVMYPIGDSLLPFRDGVAVQSIGLAGAWLYIRWDSGRAQVDGAAAA